MDYVIIQAPDHPSDPLVVPRDQVAPELLAELKRCGYIREETAAVVAPPVPRRRKGAE